ncbi:MAG: 4,5-DOPA dioxygenase extradiol [Chloroflexota bacterium]
MDTAKAPRMPVLFVGHGSPMNAIEESAFARNWRHLGEVLPRPRAILCVSAHWETPGVAVTAVERPRTIHDFYGSPEALYQVTYPAPGAPALAERVVALLAEHAAVELDDSWGLDHGAWSVLRRMVPGADIATLQLSLDYRQPPEWHYALGRALRPLRDEGVLILGSGNIVHNLGVMRPTGRAFPWAVAFDAAARDAIAAGEHASLIHYERLEGAALAVPTHEHYLPLLYVLGAAETGASPAFSAAEIVFGSISMRCVLLGAA